MTTCELKLDLKRRQKKNCFKMDVSKWNDMTLSFLIESYFKKKSLKKMSLAYFIITFINSLDTVLQFENITEKSYWSLPLV